MFEDQMASPISLHSTPIASTSTGVAPHLRPRTVCVSPNLTGSGPRLSAPVMPRVPSAESQRLPPRHLCLDFPHHHCPVLCSLSPHYLPPAFQRLSHSSSEKVTSLHSCPLTMLIRANHRWLTASMERLACPGRMTAQGRSAQRWISHRISDTTSCSDHPAWTVPLGSLLTLLSLDQLCGLVSLCSYQGLSPVPLSRCSSPHGSGSPGSHPWPGLHSQRKHSFIPIRLTCF